MDLEAERNAPLTFQKGQRLYCQTCEAEVEILSPGNAEPPGLSLRCCGQPMSANIGKQINLGVE